MTANHPQVHDPTDAALLPPPFSEADPPTPVPLAALRDLNPRGFDPSPRGVAGAPAAAALMDEGRAARRRPAPQGPTQARLRAVRAGQRYMHSSEELSAAIMALRGAGFHRNVAWALNPANSLSSRSAQAPAAGGSVGGGAARAAEIAAAGRSGNAGSTVTGPAAGVAQPAAGAAVDSGGELPRGTAAVQEILERLEVDEPGIQGGEQGSRRLASSFVTE